VTRLQ
jgi:hypothetical protein